MKIKLSHITTSIIVTTMFLVFLWAHTLVYNTVVSSFDITNPRILSGLVIALTVLTSGFFVTMAIARKIHHGVIKFFYRFFAVWVGFFFFLFLVSLFHTIAVSLVILPEPMTFLVLFVLAGLLTLYGLVQAGDTRITSYNVSLNNLPEHWEGKVVAFISDLHLGQVYEADFAQKIVTTLQEVNPHIVLIGGDMYDGVAVDEKSAVEPFRGLSPQHGIHFVTGNHETYGDERSYLQAIQGVGINILHNTVVTIEGLQIVGVNYHDTVSKDSFHEVMRSIPFKKNTPSILLKHVPFDLSVAEQAGISLHLSGHTHQAQVMPLNIISKITYRGFDYGHKWLGAMQSITSSGVGNWGPPLRVGSQSEIVLITLRNQ